MQIIQRTRREQVMFLWHETLEKAKKKLANSKKCYELFGDEVSKQWVEEDEKSVKAIEENMKKAVAFMDAHGIK